MCTGTKVSRQELPHCGGGTVFMLVKYSQLQWPHSTNSHKILHSNIPKKVNICSPSSLHQGTEQYCKKQARSYIEALSLKNVSKRANWESDGEAQKMEFFSLTDLDGMSTLRILSPGLKLNVTEDLGATENSVLIASHTSPLKFYKTLQVTQFHHIVCISLSLLIMPQALLLSLLAWKRGKRNISIISHLLLHSVVIWGAMRSPIPDVPPVRCELASDQQAAANLFTSCL